MASKQFFLTALTFVVLIHGYLSASQWEKVPGPNVWMSNYSLFPMGDTLFLQWEKEIYRSKDNGVTWELKCSMNARLLKVYGNNLIAASESSGWLYLPLYYSYLDGTMWKTIDKCDQWNWDATPEICNASSYAMTTLNVLSLPMYNHNSKIIFAGNYGTTKTMIRSIGGEINVSSNEQYLFSQIENIGNTLILKNDSSIYTVFDGKFVKLYQFQDTIKKIITLNSDLFVLTGSGLYLSTDTATIFSKRDTGLQTESFDDIQMYGNALLGFKQNSIKISRDTGKSWSESFAMPGSHFVIGNSKIFTVLPNMQVFYSSDTGKSWVSDNLPNKDTLIIDFTLTGDIFHAISLPNYVHISNDRGVYWSTRKQFTSAPLYTDEGIMRSPVIRFYNRDNELFAGTGLKMSHFDRFENVLTVCYNKGSTHWSFIR